MASVLLADNYRVPMPDCPFIGVSMIREFQYTILAALIINDTIKLCPLSVGPGICLDDYFIDVCDLDTNGTPLVTLDLGDVVTAAKFVAAATVGQSAGYLTPAVNGVAASLPAYYAPPGTAQTTSALAAGDNALILKMHAAPATSVTTGVIKGWVRYHNVTPSTPFTAITA